MRKTLAQSYVTAGMSWLDAYAMPGWYHAIDLTTLSLWSDRCCMLGQLWGSYKHAQVWFGLSNRDAITYGFVGRLAADPCGLEIAYPGITIATVEELESVWRAEIVTRRLASSPSDGYAVEGLYAVV